MWGLTKFLLKFLILFVIISVAVVLLFGGGLVTYMVNFHSERFTGVKMSVAGAEMSLLNGQITLNNVAIANPDGFTAPNAATVQSVRVSLQPRTLLTDNVVVDFVGITGLRAEFEGDQNRNNFTALQQQVDQKVAELEAQIARISPQGAAGEPVAADEQQAQTFMIKQLEIRDTSIAFRPTGPLAQVIQEPVVREVDDMLLTDIGTAEGGKTMAEVLNIVLAPLFQNLQREVMKVFANPEALLRNMGQQVQDTVGGFINNLFGD